MESKTVKGMKEDFNAAKMQVRSEFEKAKTKIDKVQHRAEGYITRNPKRATAIAAGMGAAIGAAITAYWMKEKSMAKSK